MVQVDVFWSYGIGAGLGLASAAKGLSATERPADALTSTEGFHTLLFLALVFGPSGFVLLWSFPSWETMHAGDRNLPGWLVALFGVTNVTQGLLGFVVARRLASRGRVEGAMLHWLLGYFGLFFILIHGWDGDGYRRFFSATPAQLDGWSWRSIGPFLTSDVAVTLAVMGVVLVPWLVGLSVAWLSAARAAPARARLAVGVLVLLLLVVPSFAVCASALVRALGPTVGTMMTALLITAVTSSKVGALQRLARWLGFTAARPMPLREVLA